MDCLQFPLRGSAVCFACVRLKQKCSHIVVSGNGRGGRLGDINAYRTWRAFRTLANPDIYPSPILVSQKWATKKDEDVPTWFREWRDTTTRGKSPWGMPTNGVPPKCKDFPKAPPRRRVPHDVAPSSSDEMIVPKHSIKVRHPLLILISDRMVLTFSPPISS